MHEEEDQEQTGAGNRSSSRNKTDNSHYIAKTTSSLMSFQSVESRPDNFRSLSFKILKEAQTVFYETRLHAADLSAARR